MYKKLLNRIGLLSITFLIGLNAECLCAPSTGMKQTSSDKLLDFSTKVEHEVTPSTASSDLTVVYVPYRAERFFGPGPDYLKQSLDESQDIGKAHPYGLARLVTIIQSSSQKALLLGLLDTKGTPVKSSSIDDSEILITRPSWNKSIIIDHNGVVMDGFRMYKGEFKPMSSGFRIYKLPPQAFNKLQELMKALFPLNQSYVPATGSPAKASDVMPTSQ